MRRVALIIEWNYSDTRVHVVRLPEGLPKDVLDAWLSNACAVQVIFDADAVEWCDHEPDDELSKYQWKPEHAETAMAMFRAAREQRKERG